MHNIWIIGVPEEKEEKKGSEKIFEMIIVENFTNMGKEIVTQVQEAQRVSYRINTPTFKLLGSQKKKIKRKGLRKHLKGL